MGNINFNNPEFADILAAAGFYKGTEPHIFNHKDLRALDLSIGLTTGNLRLIIQAALEAGQQSKQKEIKSALGIEE